MSAPSPSPGPLLLDARGIPTHACPACGSNIITVQVTFEEYTISAWFLDAECALCGTRLTAPCPVDAPTGPDWPPAGWGDS